ncbi:MAG: copper transporter, partial [Actinomycetota bacterium]|nr:copper transporter [Actinomycetota bacterium]
RLRPDLMGSLSGRFGGLDGVVLLRSTRRPRDADAAGRAARLDDGIARGLADTSVSVAGVETRDAEPSQIAWYRARHLSSIDNVDEPAGRAALVYVLSGSAGAFGTKSSAQALLPPVVGTVGRR